jgi:hypothetical protein
MPVLGPELDHYIQGKDQAECTPLHVAILRGEAADPQQGSKKLLAVAPHWATPICQQLHRRVQLLQVACK